MESFDASGSTDITSSIPTGLLEDTSNNEEKNIGQNQMAEFSTSLDDVVPPGPSMQMQDMAFGSVNAGSPSAIGAPPQSQQQQQAGRKIPFGLTPEQYMALLAGLAAVVATSKPVQEKVAQFMPNVEAGSVSAMAVTAALAALVFFLAHRFLN
jgi:hypothetical protein